jgi:predicted DsbA family dithiol-disulfide isomerase
MFWNWPVGIPLGSVEAEINSGAAFASLASDYQQRDRLKIEGSPTFVLNQGHQKLYGNLGYRVIEANVRELLREPGVGEMSWC